MSRLIEICVSFNRFDSGHVNCPFRMNIYNSTRIQDIFFGHKKNYQIWMVSVIKFYVTIRGCVCCIFFVSRNASHRLRIFNSVCVCFFFFRQSLIWVLLIIDLWMICMVDIILDCFVILWIAIGNTFLMIFRWMFALVVRLVGRTLKSSIKLRISKVNVKNS